jgi:putative toxin-antitoxin system antitoxin component (TIGR02293 family)
MTTSTLQRTDVRRLSLEQLAVLPDDAAIAAVKRGLPARLVREMAERLEAPLESLSEPLQLTGRTLHRRVQEGRLAQPESERLLALVRVYFHAVEVLGDETRAMRWLKSRPPVLAGRTPLECMETWLGIRQVETVLGRIEGGVYS